MNNEEDIDLDLSLEFEELNTDFADSMIIEELNADSISAELYAEFEASSFGHTTKDLIDDLWGSEGKKQERKR